MLTLNNKHKQTTTKVPITIGWNVPIVVSEYSSFINSLRFRYIERTRRPTASGTRVMATNDPVENHANNSFGLVDPHFWIILLNHVVYQCSLNGFTSSPIDFKRFDCLAFKQICNMKMKYQNGSYITIKCNAHNHVSTILGKQHCWKRIQWNPS